MGNVFGKDRGARGVQPWAAPITVGKALRELYTSLGDVTLTGANTIATLLDGPEKVVRYGALTLGDGTTATSLTASSRCKGLTIICDSLMVKANATLNMTGKGPRVITNDDPFMPFIDFRIPNQIVLTSDKISLAQALAAIKTQGLAPWDLGTFQTINQGLFGFSLSISQAGTFVLLSVSGCATGSTQYVSGQSQSAAGMAGVAGINGGTGTGGHGALSTRSDMSTVSSHGKQGAGNPYGGGNGTSGLGAYCGGAGSLSDSVAMPSTWYSYGVPGAYQGGGGAGVGATLADVPTFNGYTMGAKGGEGVGGKLVVICYGTMTVQSGGKIEANGMQGGSGFANGYSYPVSGGGSGGGHVSIITPTSGNLSNSGTIQAAGGAAGTSPWQTGGAGGVGSVVTKTFTDMGWT